MPPPIDLGFLRHHKVAGTHTAVCLFGYKLKAVGIVEHYITSECALKVGAYPVQRRQEALVPAGVVEVHLAVPEFNIENFAFLVHAPFFFNEPGRAQ